MYIKAISISDRKGIRKKNINSAKLIQNFGIKGDAHAGKWHRQISFLAQESILSMRQKGLEVVAGNFAENLTTEGIDLTNLKVGTHLEVGESQLIISQLGKICHAPCAIYHQAGDCVMPREGIFGVVARGGTITVGDTIRILDKSSASAAIISSKDLQKQHGEMLENLVTTKFQPAFTRYELLSSKKGGSVKEILADLCETQRTDSIIIFDPTGSIGLSLPLTTGSQGGLTSYDLHQSTVYYCRDLEELI